MLSLCVLLVPAPTAVVVTAPMGTIFAGSSPSLTCTVDLDPAVDVSVTVNTVWTGPALTAFTPTNPVPAVMESLTRYTSTAVVDAARDGSYTCQASVSSSSEFTTGGGTSSASTNITVGMCLLNSVS